MLSSVDMTVDPLLTVEYQRNPWGLKDMGNILFSTALRGALTGLWGQAAAVLSSGGCLFPCNRDSGEISRFYALKRKVVPIYVG